MKNKFTLLLVGSIILMTVLGCSMIRSSKRSETPAEKEKTTTDKVVDTTVGRSKIGVPECDEVVDAIELELNSSDDNFAVKTVKATFLNRIKDGIRESYEKNPEDKVELAKTCREFKIQFDKYKAEEENKK
ncbi:MAG: hypothetical protein HOP17_09960 [Acidobacteria bacterium]|nr:hypothetical protein [Acidobacteriota bacterium]